MKILTVSWISNANDTVTNAAPECGARRTHGGSGLRTLLSMHGDDILPAGVFCAAARRQAGCDA